MKKNNKGFTLIELLAVVAILAIVAVLAYNQIANRTSKSKISTIKVNADRYIKAVNDMATMSIKEDVDYEEGTYTVTDLQSTGKIKTTGTLPTGGYVVISNYEVVDACLIYENKYNVEFENAVAKNVVEDLVCLTDSDLTEEFAYTGHEEVYTVKKTGKYKLEVWGAQGGDVSTNPYIGGYGAYSVGTINLNKGDKLSIVVGGQGESNCNSKSCSGGYNGGGSSGWYTGGSVYSSGGGGATHIALKTGNSYTTLASYNDENTASDYIIIVAGGGGGATYHNNSSSFGFSHSGGSGGGATGYGLCGAGHQADSSSASGCGGSQTETGGVSSTTYGTLGGFGYGAGNTCSNNGGGEGRKCYASGAGGGWYGGSTGNHGVAGGGSGYIGNAKLKNKSMYCYGCGESSLPYEKTVATTCAEDSPTPNCAKKGNGYVKISLANNETPSSTSKVTYDYNVDNYTFLSSGYMTTDFTPDFSKDFIIDATINIPSLGKRYLIAGNYNQSNNLSIELNTNNALRVYISGSERAVSTGTVVANKDIRFTFVWDASSKSFVFTANGNGVNASTSGTVNISAVSGGPLRLGQDYRGGSTFGIYTLKSLKITQTYDYGSVISNVPTNVTRSGYTFGGWYTDKTGGTQIPSVLMASDDTTYYAH